jgi:hypothetical protein
MSATPMPPNKQHHLQQTGVDQTAAAIQSAHKRKCEGQECGVTKQAAKQHGAATSKERACMATPDCVGAPQPAAAACCLAAAAANVSDVHVSTGPVTANHVLVDPTIATNHGAAMPTTTAHAAQTSPLMDEGIQGVPRTHSVRDASYHNLSTRSCTPVQPISKGSSDSEEVRPQHSSDAPAVRRAAAATASRTGMTWTGSKCSGVVLLGSGLDQVSNSTFITAY